MIKSFQQIKHLSTTKFSFYNLVTQFIVVEVKYKSVHIRKSNFANKSLFSFLNVL